MKKLDFFVFQIAVNTLIANLYDFIRQIFNLWGVFNLKARRMGMRLLKESKVKNGTMFLALNGPSIKTQPLERVAGNGIDCVFVNQGFKLSQYKLLHPRYHIFIDTKLLKGIWDINWLDEILEMVPDITFVMPTSWARHPVLQPYIKRGIRILWWDAPRSSHGVSGYTFQLAWALGYKRIYFSGYEQTATPAYILKQASHFYGNDPDVETHDALYIMKDLYMNARHLYQAFKSEEYAKKHGYELINLTDGGIMDMFERKRFEDVFPESK